ncbi:cytotoxic translational repressor of toxin-antitoxin stability system [archaeon CG_4_10_14_0_2_um_filter_Archaea_38_6]|nr:MAG: cytotoxic translational repressor of toxin-antitoxin stability system [archaeon CG07_land_8_20_14_0_80_38_8]PIU88183.1 MAG: cytotoxic translational repressor of toxin-antitoxin stability system [archaeon CG06_land_8_20_14_3_00_37_11]PIX42190.1 MAG: cytotoxic translational repressor of toxin-antitoxin stability system [archaeon CG_4_8_14_3_um_filter_38_5]PJA22727.1 MAG: cytotoxic translational repressor of toxin-antitoxin stability system [archaeon CG_4_10_14_0_2_um_filter_Archaea_38_6]
MYEIIFTKTAKEQLEKLENNMQKRIIAVIERIRIRPGKFVKRLTGMPYYRLRVGNYRIILDIQKEKMMIIILMLGHRKNVYKK